MRFLKGITDHPAWVLLAVFGVTALLFSKLVDLETGEVQIRLDPSINRLLPDDDEDRAFYEQSRLVFGSDETILVTLVDTDVFTTFEGDNVVLLQLVAKSLLSGFRKNFSSGMWRVASFLAHRAAVSLTELNPVTTRRSDIDTDAVFQIESYRIREGQCPRRHHRGPGIGSWGT